ncbi:methyltransferase domain-containing protein [Streptomyces gibsoniae]|uniref:Protein-L-isoaspartate O-methyltransferase n=1 Tax=Streptomyces gibsoniae TaxID=3075529 RepID=A0ABU2U4P8_9ACTN|nr:methyltransferase domain-containing protein [Streptomyces sp. DSM 41699]MDT0468120.1 methyltransferase [Streptomyces sp. DSM 41699]
MTPDPVAARVEMVAELAGSGALGRGPVRDALLALPREVLIPQAYVRRSAPGEQPPRWDLLDWTAPGDREELLAVLYGGGSVLIQHDGEPVLGRTRGARSAGSITSMSTVMSVTASLLQELELRPGQRVLDVGTGAGVTAAVACHVCGDAGVVSLDRDRHVVDAARTRLGELGFRPAVVCGAGEQGLPSSAPYDRILVSFAVPRVPDALVDQLAPGGRLLVHVTTASPSWPGLAIVTREPEGRIAAELRAVEFAHRAGHGMERIVLSRAFLERIAGEPGRTTRRSRTAPPADTARGLWLAVGHLYGGLVRDFGAGPDQLVIGAPGCGSWLRVRPDGHGRWAVTTSGPRDIWDEIQDVAARWRAAGEPGSYPLVIDPGGAQRAGTRCGRLSWQLAEPSARADGSPR